MKKSLTPASGSPARRTTRDAEKTADGSSPGRKLVRDESPPDDDSGNSLEAGTSPSEESPEDWALTDGQTRPEDSREERIRLAAYRRYAQRGESDGNSIQDWLDAEAEIDEQSSASDRR